MVRAAWIITRKSLPQRVGAVALRMACGARRVLRALADFDLWVATLLCAGTIGCFLAGWELRPTVNGPPQIPPAPELTINFVGSEPLPERLTVYSDLVQTRTSQVELTLTAADVFQPDQTTTTWAVSVEDFTGYICLPKKYRPIKGRGDYIMETSAVPPLAGSPFIHVRLCWRNGSPLTIRSSYISADLPRVTAGYEEGTVTRELELDRNSLSAYSPGGGLAPTAITTQTWTWQSALSTSGDPAGESLPIYGSSIVGVQESSGETFYSGILFGIAGGAGVSMLLTLPNLIRRMMKRGEKDEEAMTNQQSADQPTTS
jgi:hypothetical protein